MKKLIILFLALAMIVSVKAIAVTPFTSGWTNCEPNAVAAGGYGNIVAVGDGTCKVAWDGVLQPCTEANRDAIFSVGTNGMTTTQIHINHLDGQSDDSFQILDGSNVLCTYTDSTSTETWMQLDCDVNFQDVKSLTLHPTGDAGSLCDAYGQVAIHMITFDAATTQVPEFGILAGVIAIVGLVAGVVIMRKRQ